MGAPSWLKDVGWVVVAHVILVTASVRKFGFWTKNLDSGLQASDLGLRTQACQL